MTKIFIIKDKVSCYFSIYKHEKYKKNCYFDSFFIYFFINFLLNYNKCSCLVNFAVKKAFFYVRIFCFNNCCLRRLIENFIFLRAKMKKVTIIQYNC